MATKNSTNTDTKEAELAASKEALSDAYEKLREAKNHFKLAAQSAGVDLKHDAVDQLLKGREKVDAIGEQATTYIQEKPLATLGIAFISGFVISQLLSRK